MMMFTSDELTHLFYRVIPASIDKLKFANAKVWTNYIAKNGGVVGFQNEMIKELSNNDKEILEIIYPLYIKLKPLYKEDISKAMTKSLEVYYLFHECTYQPKFPGWAIYDNHELIKQPEVFNYVVNFIDKYKMVTRMINSPLKKVNNVHFVNFVFVDILTGEPIINVNEAVSITTEQYLNEIIKADGHKDYQFDYEINKPNSTYEMTYLYGKAKYFNPKFPVVLTYKRRTAVAPLNPGDVTNNDSGFTLNPDFDLEGERTASSAEPEPEGSGILPLVLLAGAYFFFMK